MGTVLIFARPNTFHDIHITAHIWKVATAQRKGAKIVATGLTSTVLHAQVHILHYIVMVNVSINSTLNVGAQSCMFMYVFR